MPLVNIRENSFFKAKNEFKMLPSNENKTNLATESRAYKTCLKKEHSAYYHNLNIELRKLKKSHSKEYWKLLSNTNKKINSDIDINAFFKHFKNLNDGSQIDTNS